MCSGVCAVCTYDSLYIVLYSSLNQHKPRLGRIRCKKAGNFVKFKMANVRILEKAHENI